MPHRLAAVVIDARDPAALGAFWSALLGWPGLRSPTALFGLAFVPESAPKQGKNRVHLDLASTSAGHQAELVARALELGAVHADVGQSGVPWVVLADPEGNEFCVLEPRDVYLDAGAVAAIVTDTPDPAQAAAFWSVVTCFPVAHATERFAGLRPPPGLPWLEYLAGGPATVPDRLRLELVGRDEGLFRAPDGAAYRVRAPRGR